MAGKATHEYWKERVRQVYAFERGNVSLRDIAARLQAEERPKLAGEPPSPSTIGRILKETEGLELYFGAYWPESFGGPDLPYSSAPHFFELWKHLNGRRPSVRLARAFHWVTLAAGGDVPVDARWRAAVMSLNYDPRHIEACVRDGDYSGLNPVVPASLDDMESGRAAILVQEAHGEMPAEELSRQVSAWKNIAGFLRTQQEADEDDSQG